MVDFDHTADAACDSTMATTCQSKLSAADAMDKSKACTYYQSVLSCWSECCTDATAKLTVDGAIASANTALKSMSVSDCTLKCTAKSDAVLGKSVSIVLLLLSVFTVGLAKFHYEIA
jgi:hypothetical protein